MRKRWQKELLVEGKNVKVLNAHISLDEDLMMFRDEVREKDLSRKRYASMSRDEREATIRFVRRLLDVLSDTVPDWLEEALVLDEAGDLLEIRMGYLKTDIEEGLSTLAASTERERQELIRRGEETFGDPMRVSAVSSSDERSETDRH